MNVVLRSIELFAGGGGLALGLEACGARTVCYVERDAFAAATLVRQMEESRLAPAPVWSDASTFDGRPWRGVVDLVAGGFPCQPVSQAGARRGAEDERWLWPEFARVVREVGPRLVFVENVPGLFSLGFGEVLGNLAALGFDAEWCVLGADDAGAPHLRDRLFILAHADESGLERWSVRNGERLDERASGPAGGALDDAHRFDGRRGRAPWPPGPEDTAGWREYLDRWPGLEPAVRRGADGLARRVDRLRVLGNGVVPDQAALAWRVLWERLMLDRVSRRKEER